MKLLHLGKGKLVDADTIIGVFDLDITSQSHLTRRFLRESEQAGRVVKAAEDIPKSFVVCREGEKTTVYLSQMATATLLKRAESGLDDGIIN